MHMHMTALHALHMQDYAQPPPRHAAGHLRQEWHMSGSCPVGTVPIRRMPKAATLSAAAAMASFSPAKRHSNISILDDSNSPRQEVYTPPILESLNCTLIFLENENGNLEPRLLSFLRVYISNF
jgi:hypothetical protein